MPYTRRHPSKFPLEFHSLARSYEQRNGARLVIPLMCGKSAATNFRWRLNDFRAGLRHYEMIGEYPLFDIAIIALVPLGTNTPGTDTLYGIEIQSPEDALNRQGLGNIISAALRDYHTPGQSAPGQIRSEQIRSEQAPSGQTRSGQTFDTILQDMGFKLRDDGGK